MLLLPGKRFTTLNTIYHADAMDLLRNLPDNSVHMVLTDPPYGITQNKWDVMPDLPAWWAQVERVAKPNAAIVMTAVQPFTSLLVVSNLDNYRHEWVFEKTSPSGFLSAKYRPMRAHEDVLVFSYQPCIYQPIMREGHKPRISGKGKVSDNYGTIPTIHIDNGTRYPRTVIKFNTSDRTNTVHPTQKPVALFEYLIKTYTQPGQLVLDPYMGSGTTAVAALKTDRQYIGSELDADYHAAAVRRVQNVDPTKPTILEDGSKQLSLFGDKSA